jgi:hypothetical protein
MLPEYKAAPVQAPLNRGVGLHIKPRRSDCSGVRPSWYPFAFNVCDCDGPVDRAHAVGPAAAACVDHQLSGGPWSVDRSLGPPDCMDTPP